MLGTVGFDKRRFALPLVATMVLFFAAAKFLPPVETHANSLAASAGFTNQLYPLVAILLAGGLIMGALGLQWGGELPLRIGTSMAAVRYWRWHLAAACVICVLQVSLFQVWSQESSYFGARLALMDAHKRPYEDFEFAYGYAVIYVPYGLHLLGFSIRHALVLSLDLAAAVGVWSIGVIVGRWIADPRLRLALFWSLILCNAFVLPGPSLNYNFGRYALSFALLLLLMKHGPGSGAPLMFAATATANLLAYFMSAEMGLAFGAAGLGWVAVGYRALPKIHVIATVAAIIAVTAGLVLFARPMFTTLLAFRQMQIITPMVPHIMMILAVACFLTVCAIAVPAAAAVWRAGLDRARTLTIAQACGCAALAVALIPAVVARSWPTTTIAYGFVPIVMAVGYLDAAGARRAALIVACVFIGFVAYCAQFVIRDDVDRIVERARSHGWALAAPAQRVSPEMSAAARRNDGRLLAARFPNAYDPFGFVGYDLPHTVDFGYYPGIGQGNVVTEAGVARKIEELRRAPYYILPGRDVIDRQFSRARQEQALQQFARASLFPYAFHVDERARDVTAGFVDMLFEQCRPLATEGGLTVCAAPGSASR